MNPVFSFFSPIWLGSLVFSLEDYKWLITFPVVLIGLFFGNRFGAERFESFLGRSLYNLVVLALLTMIVDLIVWQRWVTLYQLGQLLPATAPRPPSFPN